MQEYKYYDLLTLIHYSAKVIRQNPSSLSLFSLTPKQHTPPPPPCMYIYVPMLIHCDLTHSQTQQQKSNPLIYLFSHEPQQQLQSITFLANGIACMPNQEHPLCSTIENLLLKSLSLSNSVIKNPNS
jgi:hypothetical protein